MVMAWLLREITTGPERTSSSGLDPRHPLIPISPPHPLWLTMSATAETLRPLGPDGSIFDRTRPLLPRGAHA